MTCPICQSETDQAVRPFCSKKCADIDLGRWMTGSYRVESEEIVDEFATDEERPTKPH